MIYSSSSHRPLIINHSSIRHQVKFYHHSGFVHVALLTYWWEQLQSWSGIWYWRVRRSLGSVWPTFVGKCGAMGLSSSAHTLRLTRQFSRYEGMELKIKCTYDITMTLYPPPGRPIPFLLSASHNNINLRITLASRVLWLKSLITTGICVVHLYVVVCSRRVYSGCTCHVRALLFLDVGETCAGKRWRSSSMNYNDNNRGAVLWLGRYKTIVSWLPE